MFQIKINLHSNFNPNGAVFSGISHVAAKLDISEANLLCLGKKQQLTRIQLIITLVCPLSSSPNVNCPKIPKCRFFIYEKSEDQPYKASQNRRDESLQNLIEI